MLRTALTPRFLGLLGLVLVLCATFVWLGRWQLGVAESTAQREAVEQARSQAPADLTTLLQPHAAVPGRPVVAAVRRHRPLRRRGPAARARAAGSRARPGLWVLTPFVLDDGGATLPVVRGFVTDAASATPPPEGTLTIRGGLAPGESPSPDPVPAGQIGSVDLSQLVNTWPGELYNAFGFLESESPATASGLATVPTPLGETGVQWRNAAYAVQWWIFAAFALWMWGRMVRDETRRARAEPPRTPRARHQGAERQGARRRG